jgi:hypothetical protein
LLGKTAYRFLLSVYTHRENALVRGYLPLRATHLWGATNKEREKADPLAALGMTTRKAEAEAKTEAKTKYRGLSATAAKAPPPVEMTWYGEDRKESHHTSNPLPEDDVVRYESAG